MIDTFVETFSTGTCRFNVGYYLIHLDTVFVRASHVDKIVNRTALLSHFHYLKYDLMVQAKARLSFH